MLAKQNYAPLWGNAFARSDPTNPVNTPFLNPWNSSSNTLSNKRTNPMIQNNILSYQMIDNLINQIFGQTDEREKLQAFAARILLEQQKLNSPCLTNKFGKEHAETSYGSPEYNPYSLFKFPIMTHQIKGA